MAKQVYALDAELKEAVQHLVRQMANSFQPRPKRGRRPRRSGDGASTPEEPVLTAVVMATEDIPESGEITFADVPGAVKLGIENYEDIPEDSKCWRLSAGEAAIYQLVSNIVNGDLQAIYMVPVPSTPPNTPTPTRTAYNTAGPVKKDKPLQGKLMNVKLGGGDTTQIFVIDVEKCDDA